jgi:hypothetical protein
MTLPSAEIIDHSLNQSSGTDEAFYPYYSGLNTRYKMYITSGFTTLQRAITEAVRHQSLRPSPGATARATSCATSRPVWLP